MAFLLPLTLSTILKVPAGVQSKIGLIFKAFPKKASTLDNLPPLAK